MKRSLVEARQRGEYLIKRASQLLSDNEGRIDEKIVKEVMDAVETVEKNIDVDNLQVITQSITDLNDSMMEIGKSLYSNMGDK